MAEQLSEASSIGNQLSTGFGLGIQLTEGVLDMFHEGLPAYFRWQRTSIYYYSNC